MTTKTNRRFESACAVAIGAHGKDLDDTMCRLLGAAAELDHRTDAMGRAAAQMVKRFAEYAEACARGVTYDPPTGYSSLREMDAEAMSLKVRHEMLITLLRVTHGPDGVQRYRDALEAAERAERDAARAQVA